MEIKLSEAQALCLELGFASADSWNAARTEKKIRALPAVLRDDQTPESKSCKKLLKQILKAVEDDEEITVIDDADEGSPKDEDSNVAEDKPKKKDKKSKKEAEPAEEEDEEEEDEDEDSESDDEDDEEEEEEKPKKKSSKKDKKSTEKPTKKNKKSAEKDNSKPGVIATIVELLLGASEQKPVTKEQMLDKLAKKFPERAREAMAKTINVQVPNRINNEKPVKVQKNDKGYWATEKSKKKKS